MGIFNDNSQNDHYGHIKVVERGPPGPAGTGFELTDKGNYDIDGKRLTDVSKPVDGTDAATKAYVDEKTSHNTSNLYHLRQSFEFYDSSGTKLALSTDNITGLLSDYKYGYYKIAKGGDEITYSYVLLKIKNNLPQSTYSALFHMYGYKNNKIITGLDLGPILYVSDPENYHILKFDDDDSLDTRHDTKGIIWFTADGNGSFNIELRFWVKSITHFVVLSRCVEGEVNLGFRIDIFNVPHNSSSTFYFEDINMNGRKIKNLGDPTDGGDATNKKYIDTENAKQDIAIADKANKSYVDGEIAKVNIDTTPLLPRNGSRSMFGDLDMDGNHILSVENLDDYKDTDSYEYRVKDVKSVVNKEYLNENFLKKVDKDGIEYYDLKQIVIKNSAPHDDGSYDNDTLVSKAFVDAEISKLPKPDTDVLKLDGSKAMTGDLNMNNNEIKNLKEPQPSDASYAASVNFVNKTVNGSNVIINGIIDNKIQESEERSIQSVQQENIFKKVMTDNLFKEDDDRIEFLSTINYNLLHRINHLTYLFRIKKDPPESYNGRLSIDLRYLPSGTYTMVFEMIFFPQIDHNKVSVNAVSSSLNQVSTKTRVINFDHGYYSRSIINFQKLFTNPGVDDLDIDLHLSLKYSVSPKPDKTPINVIVYGVRGTHSDIHIQTWDKLYDINNGTLEFEIPINMNGKAITNLKDPVNDQDAATKKYVKSVSDSHVTSSDKTNAFQYVMNNPSHLIEEDDIKFGNLITFQSSPHSINKKVIDTKLIFDAGHGYYSSRASINLYVLPNGSYTMAFELIWSSDDVDHDTVSLNGISAVETIHDLSNKTFNNYSRLIMQFSKSTDTAPNHLYVDIVIKMKSGKSYPQKLQTYMVCYGIKGLQSDVPSQVYDALWGVDGGVVTFNESIDMGGNKITGVADGTANKDVVNISQLDALETKLKYYYYTNQLRHNNISTVLYNHFNKYPFSSNASHQIRIILSGYYHIIYTDYYKKSGDFELRDSSNDTILFTIGIIYKSDWTPITINTIVYIDTTNVFRNVDLALRIKSNDNAVFRGVGYSSLYIKYLHS